MTPVTPAMPANKAEYLRSGLSTVKGWLNPSTAVYLSALEVLQRDLPVTGDVCEIGIHHGRSFLCLALDLPAGQRAVAVDVFDDTESNVDGSGSGDRGIFEKHLAEFGAGAEVEVIQASSLVLPEQGFLDAGPRFRIFSIDGGHTAAITRNDLEIAERTLVDGGVVVLDDILNRHWTGVISGLFGYWAAGGTLVPTALVPNKLLLAGSAEDAAGYRRLLRAHIGTALEKADVPFGDAEVDVYGHVAWTVADQAGGSGPLAGAAEAEVTVAEPVRTVPVAHLTELAGTIRELTRRNRDLERELHNRTLRARLARRMPWLARHLRPIIGRHRRAQH